MERSAPGRFDGTSGSFTETRLVERLRDAAISRSMARSTTSLRLLPLRAANILISRRTGSGTSMVVRIT